MKVDEAAEIKKKTEEKPSKEKAEEEKNWSKLMSSVILQNIDLCASVPYWQRESFLFQAGYGTDQHKSLGFMWNCTRTISKFEKLK